jgi:hypothetical protein
MKVAGGSSTESIEERDTRIMISLINYEVISDELLENSDYFGRKTSFSGRA